MRSIAAAVTLSADRFKLQFLYIFSISLPMSLRVCTEINII